MPGLATSKERAEITLTAVTYRGKYYRLLNICTANIEGYPDVGND